MKTAAAWHAGVASDPGLKRPINEDRVLADDARGVFLVVDGLGGHAAGEMAAETAVQVIAERITPDTGNLEDQIRLVITEANNRIYELAQTNEDLRGMACVLTLAIAHEDRVTVGHVGDSRLYLVWNGNLRKLTSDHSPVGEQEDGGELTEQEAMKHPRRNEVFRDVGSQLREPDDPHFIETKSFLFRPDAALLLCSDGLSDVLASVQISAIIEQFDGNPAGTAQQLVEAANEAGGKDNVSVVFVPGPEFLGSDSNTLQEARSRHAGTRVRDEKPAWHAAGLRFLWLLAGIALGVLLWAGIERSVWRTPYPSAKQNVPLASSRISVNPADTFGIIKALLVARPGDTVEVPGGQYLGPIHVKEHVNIIGLAGQAVLRPDPASQTESGIAVVARGVRNARLQGLRIIADETHPVRTGILIADSFVEVDDVEVAGATDAGIRFEGSSGGVLLANFIHANLGPGVVISDHSSPRLIGNHISQNGNIATGLRAGIEIAPSAKPILANNVVVENGLDGPGM